MREAMHHRPHVGESLDKKCPGESRDRRQAGGCQGLGEEWGVTVKGDGFPLGDEMFWNWAEVLVTHIVTAQCHPSVHVEMVDLM